MLSFNDAAEFAKISLREEGNRLKPNDWILFTQQAALHFSKDKPKEFLTDITGNGTGLYQLTTTVANWANRFSIVKRVEYPINNFPQTYLAADNFSKYKSSTDIEKLAFKDISPSAAETIRVTFTGLHTFNEQISTIDDQDKVTFCLLLAYYAAQALAADYLKANRSNLPNDSVDYSQKYRDMQDLANTLYKKYSEQVTGKTEAVKTYVTKLKNFNMTGKYGQKYLTVPEGDR